MPIRIPDALPAAAQLESENIFVMTEYRALHQDIRPLRVLILNLMPTKIATETQIMRKLSNTPLQVEVDLLRTKTHEATHVSAGHLETFYRTFDDIRDIHYDGLIITGAPWSRCRSRRSTTGPSSARSWTGLPRTYTLRCTFVGARRRGSTIITVSRSTTCRPRRAACSSIIW